MRRWAEMLGKPEAAKLFEDTLKEEKATDGNLTDFADNAANQKAQDMALMVSFENRGYQPAVLVAGIGPTGRIFRARW